MSGKVKWLQHITVRPEPVEGQMVGLGNSPTRPDILNLQVALCSMMNPFSYREICLNVPADEINIEDIGHPHQTFLGFYIDFF